MPSQVHARKAKRARGTRPTLGIRTVPQTHDPQDATRDSSTVS
jgi:hypothetical protein